MEKEKTPVERLHDDIRRAVDKIEDDMDEMVRTMFGCRSDTVSYTHLTLPTKDSV